ncbi:MULTISPECIES: DUF4214 domain-containing protein [unclassified Chelatococcus]|uniref:DUF4214 domain-containing protein n=1 Tax=unclassified Chelatococcus TaxID=2638111 RepID=UPI001BCDD456|nr:MULTISPECIES: DUF4214 domain-containing protein [unclassified Chelatococcus]MBS7699042.1 DUF4214 domain-containing protein [Chelatococcus sp. YT9]MBX3559965.1 DUF4214 domain-containing protein [Chelatococcus sp.]
MTLPADVVIQRYEGILRSTPSEAQVAAYADSPSVEALDNALLAAATVTVDPVVRLYQAVFGRVPDSDGLDFWVAQYNGGQGLTLPELASAFGDSGEFESQYGGLSNSEIVGRLYANVLGRPGDAAGIAFWTEVLNNGGSLAEVIVGFSQSPEFIESTEPYVEGFLLAAADGEGIYTGSLFDVLTTVYDLTVQADHIVGTGSDEIFSAPLKTGLDGLFATQTLQGVDVLDGGDGHDILKAELNGFTGIGGSDDPSIKNIEEFQLTSRDNDAELDMTRVEGVEEVRNVNSTRDLDVYEIQNSVLLGLDNVSGNTTFYASYAADALGSDHAAQAVEINKVGKDEDNRTELHVHANGDDVITDLALTVTGDNYLQINYGLHGTVENLTIDGDGDLNVRGNWFQQQWDSLKTLDASTMSGDLDIDLRGSEVLESVETGSGDDRVVVNGANFDGEDILIDLGAGDNEFALAKVYDDGDINALDFTGTTLVGFNGVLEFVDDISLGGDATLDLDGIGDQVTTLDFTFVDGNGNWLTLANTVDVLTIDSEFGIEDLSLNVGDVADLTVKSFDGTIDIDALSGAALTTLKIETSDLLNGNVWVDVDGGDDVASLQNVDVAAAADAAVEFDASAPGEDLDALRNVNVVAGGDAYLEFEGVAGVPYDPGTQEVATFTVNVTGVNVGAGLGETSQTSGQIVLSSQGFPGGSIIVPYATSFANPFGFGIGPTSPLHDQGVAQDIVDYLNTNLSSLLTATRNGADVEIVWNDVGNQGDVTSFPLAISQGTWTNPVINTVQGTPEVPLVLPEGFDSLETVNVEGGQDADAHIHDVVGSFTFTATAGVDSDVQFINTGVVTAAIAAGNDVDVDVYGSTSGNAGLISLSVVAGNNANVELADDLASFTTLDVSGVVANLTVDASDALYGATAVEYHLGATDFVNFTAEDLYATREIFTFDGAGVGDITIDFFEGGNTATSDRIDLSVFGVTSAGQLSFVNDGVDLHITSITGAFAGEITLVGLGADANDVSQFNIIYA